MIAEEAMVPLKPFEDLVSFCVEINQCVGCTLSSRRRADGVEVDSTSQHERAVKFFDFHTGIIDAWRDPKSAFALVLFTIRREDAYPVSRVDTSLCCLSRAAETLETVPLTTAAQVLLVRVLVETSITVSGSG